MLRVTVRSLLAHKLRLLLSGAAVVLGIAFVAGSLILTDTMRHTFDQLFAETTSDVVVQPRSAVGGTDAFTDDSTVLTLPASLLDTVKAVPGVGRAVGEISVDGVRILGPTGAILGSGGAPGIGVRWTDRPGVTTLLRGRAPTSAAEVAIDSVSARTGQLSLGSRIALLMPSGPPTTATLVGVFRYGSTGNLAGATMVAFDGATAGKLLPGGAGFTSLAVTAADGVSDEALRSRVARVLPASAAARTGAEDAAATSASVSQSLSFITPVLLGFAGVALFVACFLIFNTFSMVVAQRTRESALLRALGASRRQVTRSVLGEAGALGLVGATTGFGTGVLLVVGLLALMRRNGLDVASGSLVIAPRTVVISLVTGVVVTLVASYLPARRAASVSPVAAMRDDLGPDERSLRRRASIGLIGATAATAALAGSLRMAGKPAGLTFAGGALLALLTAMVLAPLVSIPVLSVLSVPLRALAGTVGRLSTQNARRNPRRTAVTASALMIGLTLITGIGVLASSSKVSLDKLVDDSMGASYVAFGNNDGAFTGDVADRLGASPGIAGVVRERIDTARISIAGRADSTTDVTSIGGPAIAAALRLKANRAM